MGGCLSSGSGDHSIHTFKYTANYAFVISAKGQYLIQHTTPVFASEVLAQPSSFFLCNSDKLFYDHCISALDSEEELDAGQIYFILPKTMLGTPLTASHMASLAVKASLALDQSSASQSQKRKTNKNNGRSRVSPMMLMETNVVVEEKDDDDLDGFGVGVSRWGSIRKTRRHSSKKGRMGVGSCRLNFDFILMGYIYIGVIGW